MTTDARLFGLELVPYGLRRTFAKHVRSGQTRIEHIQLALGHENIQTNQRHFGSELGLADAAFDRRGIQPSQP